MEDEEEGRRTTTMTVWMRVACDGTVSTMRGPHEEVHKHLGGQVTFVGALPSIGAFILARADASECPCHPWAVGAAPGVFLESTEVRGDLAVVCSDSDGAAADLDVRTATRLLRPVSGAGEKNGPRVEEDAA